MERFEKLELIKRSLGIRHKLKVLESMKGADNHDDLAISLLAKWELEDELRAIEELIAGSRAENVAHKRKLLENEKGLPPFESRDSGKSKKKTRK